MGGGAGPRPFTPPPPPPTPSWKLAGKCRTVGAKVAKRKICLMRQRVKNGFPPHVSKLQTLGFFRRTQ